MTESLFEMILFIFAKGRIVLLNKVAKQDLHLLHLSLICIQYCFGSNLLVSSNNADII